MSLETVTDVAKTFGPKAAIAAGIIAIGVVGFKKLGRKVSITVNGVTEDGKLNITVTNLRKKNLTVTYHFTQNCKRSNNYSTSLKPKEMRVVELKEDILGDTINGIKFHILEVTKN